MCCTDFVCLTFNQVTAKKQFVVVTVNHGGIMNQTLSRKSIFLQKEKLIKTLHLHKVVIHYQETCKKHSFILLLFFYIFSLSKL